jgi:hypothetical protein
MPTASNGSGIWTNSDGLHVRFGLKEAQIAESGSPATVGAFKEVIVMIDKDTMAAFGTNLVADQTPAVLIPAGLMLHSAELVTIEAFDSAADALTLSIGLAKQDGTEIDNDGIDSAIAQAAIDAVGEKVTCDGALIGTVLAYDSLVTILANTATATAGRARLTLKLMHV